MPPHKCCGCLFVCLSTPYHFPFPCACVILSRRHRCCLRGLLLSLYPAVKHSRGHVLDHRPCCAVFVRLSKAFRMALDMRLACVIHLCLTNMQFQSSHFSRSLDTDDPEHLRVGQDAMETQYVQSCRKMNRMVLLACI